jgi:hypothetical protein
MHEAALEVRAALVAGAPPAQLLGSLGTPAASCAVHVLGRGLPLRQWALEGWQGRPIAQETASGILIGALGTIAGRRAAAPPAAAQGGIGGEIGRNR